MNGSTVIMIVVAIIGLFGSLFAGLGTHYYFRQRKRTRQASSAVLQLSSQEVRSVRVKRVAAWVLLAASFPLFILGVSILWFSFVPRAVTVPHTVTAPQAATSCSKNAEVGFTVEHPTNNQKVDRVTTMYGTACNLVKGQHAWPIVLAETSNVYFLLGSELAITDAHTWSRDITLGDTSESVRGHPYMVSVIIVNDATNAMLNSILSKRNTVHTITHIPPGAQTMFTIMLIRQ